MDIDGKLLSKIKKEYLTTKTSYRKLAEKYGLCHTSLARAGKKDGWEEQRRQARDMAATKAATKAVDAASDLMAAREAKFFQVADKLMDRIDALVKQAEAEGLAAKDIRALSASLKDLREINGIKSEADRAEQEARIAKLRREVDGDNTPNTITVTIQGGEGEWGR